MYYIYGLIDPRDKDKVRYVGQTQCISQRLNGHYKCRRSKRLKQWIDDLRDAGLVPSYVILSQANTRIESLKIESQQISKLKPDINRPMIKSKSDNKMPSHGSLESVERLAIIQALQQNAYNKRLSAKQLRIGRQTLYNKIHQYGIEC